MTGEIEPELALI